MAPLLPALLALIAVLPSNASADGNDPVISVRAATAKLKAGGGGRPAVSASPARCVGKGPSGRKYLHVTFYAASNVPFVNDRAADAAAAFIRYNVELSRRGGPTGWTPTRGPIEIATGHRPAGVAVEKIDAPDELCKVVRDAFASAAPAAGSLPVFFLRFGDGMKKIMGAEAVGKMYGAGLKSMCDEAGEPGLTDARLAVIDLEPVSVIMQVTAHEIGHAVGSQAHAAHGTSMALFDDIADKSVDNIMVTQRGLTSRDQMQLNSLQAGVLCASGYVSDAP